MVGIDLGAARVAAPEAPAERFGAAAQNVGDGAPMRRQHRRAPFASIMSRQVVVREAAEDLRNLDHGRCLPSQAGHQLIEDAFERCPGGLGQVHIDGGRRDVDVAEQDLHDPRIDAAFQKSSRIAMPQSMRADRLCDARRANTETEGAPQRILADRPGAEAIRAEPALVAVGQPKGRRRSSSIGCGSGTRRSLSPLPMIRRSRLALSTLAISTVAASPMRRPQAYMSAKQVLWMGFLTQPRSARISASDSTAGRRCFLGRADSFLRIAARRDQAS